MRLHRLIIFKVRNRNVQSYFLAKGKSYGCVSKGRRIVFCTWKTELHACKDSPLSRVKTADTWHVCCGALGPVGASA